MIRNRSRQEEGVELNLAAMLDMAFQLLTFFILTFSPVSQETGFHFHMPLPMPVAGPPGSSTRPGNNRAAAELRPLETLTVSVLATPDGQIRQIAIEDAVVGQRELAERLQTIFADRVAGFQQVLLQVDSRLAYGELMQVIDICSRIRLPTEARVQKLSFVELPVGPGR